jgi:serine/threonine protein kinase
MLGRRVMQHYKIEKLLGRGGMGEVYYGVHDLTGQVVAIKCLPAYLSEHEDFKLRFLREAKILVKLEHPAIVPILTFVEEEGNFFLITRFIEGEDLHTKIKKNGPVSIEFSLSVAEEVLDALKYAHSKNVVHRDIKPSNIIINSEGHALLLDFGIARITGETGQTVTKGTIGTLEYMSPEQILCTGTDHRSDIYSFGITMYHALTGQVPFKQTSETGIEVLDAHRFKNPAPPGLLRSDIPEFMEQAIMKSLEKNREQRIQSAEEFMHMLGFSGKKAVLREFEKVHKESLMEDIPETIIDTRIEQKLRSMPDDAEKSSSAEGTAPQFRENEQERSVEKPFRKRRGSRIILTVSAGIVLLLLLFGYGFYILSMVLFEKSDSKEVAVEGGEYFTGCLEEKDRNCNTDEKNGYSSVLKDFSIGRYEETVEDFMKCVDAGYCSKSSFKTSKDYPLCNFGSDKKNHPMNCVNFYGADSFCRWAKKRLPTEAEWEAAARGHQRIVYPWGDDEATGKHANFCVSGCEKKGTSPAGSFAEGVSKQGIHDMAGNVMEWASSEYDQRGHAADKSAVPPASGLKVLKGGSFYDSPGSLRISSRRGYEPDKMNVDIGFRCVK